MKKSSIFFMVTFLLCLCTGMCVWGQGDEIALYENTEYTNTVFSQGEEGITLTTFPTEEALEHAVIISLYHDGRLVTSRMFAEEGPRIFTLTEEKNFNAVKVFVWENTSFLKPLCNVYYKNGSCQNATEEEAHVILAEGPVVAPTCTQAGVLPTRHCLQCGKVFQEEKIIPALGHSAVVKTVLPTCTVPGFTEGTHCTDCGETDIFYTSIPATGHSYGDWVVTKEPTTKAEGEEMCTCLTCGDTKTRPIDKLIDYVAENAEMVKNLELVSKDISNNMGSFSGDGRRMIRIIRTCIDNSILAADAHIIDKTYIKKSFPAEVEQAKSLFNGIKADPEKKAIFQAEIATLNTDTIGWLVDALGIDDTEFA